MLLLHNSFGEFVKREAPKGLVIAYFVWQMFNRLLFLHIGVHSNFESGLTAKRPAS